MNDSHRQAFLKQLANAFDQAAIAKELLRRIDLLDQALKLLQHAEYAHDTCPWCQQCLVPDSNDPELSHLTNCPYTQLLKDANPTST